MSRISPLKFKPQDWYSEHADACPFSVSFTVPGFTLKHKNKVPKYRAVLCFYKDNQCDWTTLILDQQAIGKAIINEALKDKSYFLNLYKSWKKDFDLIPGFSKKLLGQDFSKLSDSQLVKLFKNYADFYTKKVCFTGFTDAFMFYSDQRLNDLVFKFCEKNKIKNPAEIFTALSAPVDKSFLAEADEDLFNIASLAKKIEFSRRVEQRIKNHIEKFYYIKSNYALYKPYNREEAVLEIKKIISENKKFDKNQHLKNRQAKEKLFKRYKFSEEIKVLSSLTGLFAKWQDERKIYTLSHVVLDDKFLRELERRTEVDIDLLKYSRTWEFVDVLTGRIKKNDLEQRQKGCLFLYQNGKGKLITAGSNAENVFKKLVSVKSELNVKEIKGITASPGKVVGVAKIIKTYRDNSKVKKGDILVAPMTRPEYVPAIKVARAVVTDDGGITCHAAIISRELKIPCVIGTKIATKVLKDGDLVEVDANNGVVKILKK